MILYLDISMKMYTRNAKEYIKIKIYSYQTVYKIYLNQQIYSSVKKNMNQNISNI